MSRPALAPRIHIPLRAITLFLFYWVDVGEDGVCVPPLQQYLGPWDEVIEEGGSFSRVFAGHLEVHRVVLGETCALEEKVIQ